MSDLRSRATEGSKMRDVELVPTRSRFFVDHDGTTTTIFVIDGRSSIPQGSAGAGWGQTLGAALVREVCL